MPGNILMRDPLFILQLIHDPLADPWILHAPQIILRRCLPVHHHPRLIILIGH
jgi:hypothetical protein